MSATRKRPRSEWCRRSAIAASTLLVAICIACGGGGPGSQTSAKKKKESAVKVLSLDVGEADGAKFEVSVEDIDGVRLCNITFSGKLPSPATVDKIVRESLEKAVRKDPSKDILATAFMGNDTLTSNQYSGKLVYKAAEKKILTLDEYRGVKVSTFSTSSYFVQIKEDQTYPGIEPAKKWLSLTIVFPKTPSRKIAYDAIFTEIAKVATKGLDVNACVSVGDKNVKTSWKQMRDNDGAYVFAKYDSATREVTRKGEVLKKLK
ncbi:MAG: hypothetical protein C4297_04605 [Gemmataceae bacterium]